MEGKFLTPEEQLYYTELFSKSDTEGCGRVAAQRAMKLFQLSPQLSNDVIQKINQVCGAERLGYYGRSQFYCALKMIAMVQNGLPLPKSVEFVMQAGIEVPLPEFGQEVVPTQRPHADSDASGQMEFVNPAFNITDTEFTLGERKGSTISSVPPLKPTRPANSNVFISPRAAHSPTHIAQPPSSPPISPSQSPPAFMQQPAGTSPARTSGSLERNQSLPASVMLDATQAMDPSMCRLEKQTSAPPAPALSRTEEGWASFEKTTEEAEEQSEDTSWARFPQATSPTSSCSSASAPTSSHHTSESPIDSRSGVADSQEGDAEEEEEDDEDDDDVDEEEEEEEKEEEEDEEDVWQINSEQREYYNNQFKMLQPDPDGLLPGGEAKGFFEKSKLPTEELSKIWQLSDVNKDGTLSLEEFCTAMHLVVLRKHNIPLPERLPACLIPKMPTFNGNGPAPAVQTAPVPAPSSQPITTTTIHPIQPHAHTGRSVTPPSSGSEMKNTDDNWATFVDSPFPGPPTPTSQPPVSFDFASISPDPDAKIFQPIALHLSPDGKPVQPDSEASELRPRTFSDPVHQEAVEESHIVAPTPIKPRAMTISTNNSDHTPAKIAPPPEWDSLAASPCQTVGEVVEKIPPHPRIPRNRSSQPEDNAGSHSGVTSRTQRVERLAVSRQQKVRAENAMVAERAATLPRPQPKKRGGAKQFHHIVHDAVPQNSSLQGSNGAAPPSDSLRLALPQATTEEGGASSVEKSAESSQAVLPALLSARDMKKLEGQNQPRPNATDSQGGVPFSGASLPRPRPSESLNATLAAEGSLPLPKPEGTALPAPPPPPRKQRNHSRSNSLDLNLVFQGEKSGSTSSPRPVIPPRPTAQQVQQSKAMSMDVSMEPGFADFSKFEAMKTKSSSLKADRRGVSLDCNNKVPQDQTFPPVPPPRPSASEENLIEGSEQLSPDSLSSKGRHASGDPDAAEKKREQFSKERTRHMSAPVPLGVAELRTGNKKSVQARIRQEKEENTKLSRHNGEMQQELRALTDQRLALEIQLERLRPFSNTAS
ncbi:uncharacterized protein [Diadema setosum]|uniref:uncharacterized protein n=1 Tax=Diadema setosum TaxID=31175 RepID=UPI003B3ABAEA